MGEVLVVTSGKGGTGKTTLCAGLASCLAAMGQRVLAIDCDIGLSNLDIALGMTDCATVSFLDVMMENQYLSDAPEHGRGLTAPRAAQQQIQHMSLSPLVWACRDDTMTAKPEWYIARFFGCPARGEKNG